MTHGRQLQITVAAVCGRKRDREKGMDRQTERRKSKEGEKEREVMKGGKDGEKKEGGWGRH